MEINRPLTPAEIAAWMVSEFKRNQILFHDIAASQIRERFGAEFASLTEDGNFSIEPKVLLAFRTITKDAVVWERQKRYWRKRTDCDERGRSQDLQAREAGQRERDVSVFLTARAGKYLCNKCISELTGINPASHVSRFIAKPTSGLRGPGGQTFFCHRVKTICIRCSQKRMATAYLPAEPINHN